jgi:RIO kinase 1
MDENKKMRGLDKRIDDYRSKIKDSNDLKLESGVFDVPTLKTLYTMANKGIITAFGGVVSTGKEADVFHAIGENGREMAVKIYRISTSDFQSMENYLIGDPRFSNIRGTKKDIVFAWTKKEHRNLERAREAGIKAPEPYTSERNILVMEFIGKDGVSAPRLKDVKPAEPQRIYDTVAQYMRLLYQKAKLVHGDLSEYNVLLYEDEPVIIDMGQAVMLDHPMSREFLARDVKNVVRYFKKLGVDCSEESLNALILKKD